MTSKKIKVISTMADWSFALKDESIDLKMGFEVVAVMKTERGAGPLAGTWEAWLKRKVHGRSGVKP